MQGGSVSGMVKQMPQSDKQWAVHQRLVEYEMPNQHQQ